MHKFLVPRVRTSFLSDKCGNFLVVKAGKPFSDYELICEIQVKNGLDLGENYRNINGCKTFATSCLKSLQNKNI
jgi:hypothetical protein